MSDKIKVGDLVSSKWLNIGLVYKTTPSRWNPDERGEVIYFIDQQNGEKSWHWSHECTKLNKPTEETP